MFQLNTGTKNLVLHFELMTIRSLCFPANTQTAKGGTLLWHLETTLIMYSLRNKDKPIKNRIESLHKFQSQIVLNADVLDWVLRLPDTIVIKHNRWTCHCPCFIVQVK